MSKLWATLRAEPVATMAIVSAAIGVAVIAGAPNEIMGALGVLAGAILAFPVRGAVSPLASVVKTTRTAALDAAAQVASRLDPETAGTAGTITDHAVQLADTAADTAADAALRAAGIKRKVRTA